MIASLTRFNIIGTSGSGKTTFGQQLASTLSLPFVELDALFWKADWQQSGIEEFSGRVGNAVDQPQWVVDGNYSRVRQITWQRVECVVWLDFRFSVVFRRSLTRAIKRARSGQELWPGTGNIETFRKTFFSSDSILLWMLRQYSRNRRRFNALMEDHQYRNIHFVRLKSPGDAASFIARLENKKTVSEM